MPRTDGKLGTLERVGYLVQSSSTTHMSNRSCEKTSEQYDRYVHFETSSGCVVMYDRENPDAWLLSDTHSTFQERTDTDDS